MPLSRWRHRLEVAVHWQANACTVSLASAAPCFPVSAAEAFRAPPQDKSKPAAAPNAVQPKREGEVPQPPPIVITGSRIPRADLTAVSPVTTVSGEEFRLQGTPNVEEVLNRLPQVNPSEGEFVSVGATGLATVDLRGLGSVRTLVLVNGKNERCLAISRVAIRIANALEVRSRAVDQRSNKQSPPD